MPIYEYVCATCGACFTVLRLTIRIDDETTCPGCGSGEVKKLISAFAVCAPGGEYSASGAG